MDILKGIGVVKLILQGVRFRWIFFSYVKKSSIFVRFWQDLANLNPKTWGFVILCKKCKKIFLVERKVTNLRGVIFS